MRTCNLCSQTKDDADFHPRGRQCKRCLADRAALRYHGKYRALRLAERRQRDSDRKNQPTGHSEAIRAYAAGLIDGEGCIGITRRGARDGRYAVAHQNGQHGMSVWVSNTAKPMIDFLVAHWGGSVRYVPAQPDTNRREQWFWVLSANKALRLLDDVYEFLIVKRRQAQLARRFQRYVQVTGRERTEKIHRLQCRFYDDFKELNRRGYRPPTLRTG